MDEKAMRLLEDDASKRAALPALTALEDKAVWSNLKIRALAVICRLNPPPARLAEEPAPDELADGHASSPPGCTI